jgi:hypothetical protein
LAEHLGIRYVYDDTEQREAVVERSDAFVLTSKRFATLPVELLCELRSAVDDGDVERRSASPKRFARWANYSRLRSSPKSEVKGSTTCSFYLTKRVAIRADGNSRPIKIPPVGVPVRPRMAATSNPSRALA